MLYDRRANSSKAEVFAERIPQNKQKLDISSLLDSLAFDGDFSLSQLSRFGFTTINFSNILLSLEYQAQKSFREGFRFEENMLCGTGSRLGRVGLRTKFDSVEEDKEFWNWKES